MTNEDTVAYWRDRAEEARVTAKGVKGASAKQAILQVAASYDAMAERAQGAVNVERLPRSA